jgi:hypothetical protein
MPILRAIYVFFTFIFLFLFFIPPSTIILLFCPFVYHIYTGLSQEITIKGTLLVIEGKFGNPIHESHQPRFLFLLYVIEISDEFTPVVHQSIL